MRRRRRELAAARITRVINAELGGASFARPRRACI